MAVVALDQGRGAESEVRAALALAGLRDFSLGDAHAASCGIGGEDAAV
jgi:hypothetical protein